MTEKVKQDKKKQTHLKTTDYKIPDLGQSLELISSGMVKSS